MKISGQKLTAFLSLNGDIPSQPHMPSRHRCPGSKYVGWSIRTYVTMMTTTAPTRDSKITIRMIIWCHLMVIWWSFGVIWGHHYFRCSYTRCCYPPPKAPITETHTDTCLKASQSGTLS